ncbi:oxidoreductase [Malassezia pachydermatis]|uniref:Alpha-ketoglutarate dependent xanthine dioxygenase n=1 Tax=Malassezia pachydermatis TaxID=77020 RepID=A0A0M8MUB3_9BASI|nr:alpha-ketoglutarate dependent xanthine dioxygenase [Malassezia pachydermatis]KOS13751.1 alpha-ketoglutarate dependent xanthine dioxygenase [Malassezia pachydermatis]
MASNVRIVPLSQPDGSHINFGALVENVDLETLTDEQFEVIHDGLYKHQVLVFKNQGHVTPKTQYELTKRFDPASDTYGHGTDVSSTAKSILHPDLKTIPHQPQVQVIGHGFVKEFEGLKDITLRHPHHRTFHKDRIPEDKDLDYTRFYRWHIDAALYGRHPPKVTTLLAVSVPAGRRQTLLYDDGTGETLDVPLGTTAFVSGETMYERLSEDEKAFVRESKVEYAPHPYVWMGKCRSLSTGLGLHSEGLELKKEELPPIEADKIQILPMVWKNPLTGKLAVQIHPSAMRKIHRKDGSVIDDLREVREIVYNLQRPAISPSYVYPHDWEEGDLVLFHNRGVLHTVVGAFSDKEVRIFRQCNLAASEGVKGAV